MVFTEKCAIPPIPHPLSFGLVYALAAVSAYSLTQPANPDVTAEMPAILVRTTDSVIVLAAVLFTVSVILCRRSLGRDPKAVTLELAAMLGLGFSMLTYAALLYNAAPEFWGTWMQSVILTLACFWQSVRLAKVLVLMMKVTRDFNRD